MIPTVESCRMWQILVDGSMSIELRHGVSQEQERGKKLPDGDR